MENNKRLLTSFRGLDDSSNCHKNEKSIGKSSARPVEDVNVGNGFFLAEVKEEHQDLLLVASHGNGVTNTVGGGPIKELFLTDGFLYEQDMLEPEVIVKLESNLIEKDRHHLDHSDEMSGTTLNEYEAFSPKPIEVVPVKIEACGKIKQEVDPQDEDFEGNQFLSAYFPPKIETTVLTETDEQEIKEISEIVFDEWKLKNEEVDLKQEDVEQNQTIMSSSAICPEKSDVYKNLKKYNHKTADKGNFGRLLVNSQLQDPNMVAGKMNLKGRQKYPKNGNLFKCNECHYQTIYKGDLNRHLLRHKDLSEVHTFNCDKCSYKAIKRGHLNRHQLRHKDPKELNMFSCDKCDFKSRYKESLNGHLLLHKNIDEVDTFNCSKCSFVTVAKSSLKRHELRHEDAEKVNLLKCTLCEYQTIDKSYLSRHLLRHKDLGELCTFNCDECSYSTTDKTYLRKHQRRHRDRNEINMFGCYSCDFKTHNKDNLKTHLLRHQNIEEVDAYKCNYCQYKTLLKGDLNRHQLRHRNPDEVDMFSCEMCDFRTAHKKSLKRHMLRHEDIEKLDTFKCNICEYKTVQKAHLKRHQLRHDKTLRHEMIKAGDYTIIREGERSSQVQVEPM